MSRPSKRQKRSSSTTEPVASLGFKTSQLSDKMDALTAELATFRTVLIRLSNYLSDAPKPEAEEQKTDEEDATQAVDWENDEY